MSTAIESGQTTRNNDLLDEPIDRLLIPIRGYEAEPILPLTETVESISGLFNNIQDHVYVALHNCQHPLDGLNQQESAAIQLYTMNFRGGPTLYQLLNNTLRTENREELKPWFSFLKLFLTAIYKLPSQSGTVWRGIKDVDLSSKYKKGTKFVWWGVSSCTTDIEVLESNTFLGKNGERTIFSIECMNGKSISNHSYYRNKEKEIILMPGSYFEVIGQLNPSPQLYIIQIKEIQSPITFITLPCNVPPAKQPTPIDQNANIILKEKSVNFNYEMKQNGIIIAGGNGQGSQSNQLYYPFGICNDDNQTIYIADCWNHRIIEWKIDFQESRIVAGGNEKGQQRNQLSYPTDVLIDKENHCLIITDRGNRRVMRWSLENNTTHGQILIEDINCWGLAMDKDGSLYVSDYENNEVRRWKRGEKNGKIIAGGNGKGDQRNQFNGPTYLFADENYSLYVSDSNNYRVMKWVKDAKEGMIVAGGNGKGKGLNQLSSPAGLIVDYLGQIYVSDCFNHRVMCWCETDIVGKIVIGGNIYRNQLCCPNGLSFDVEGNLYVVEQIFHQISKFEVDLS